MSRIFGKEPSMISVTSEWNSKQSLLKELIQIKNKFHEAITLCMEMHTLVHTSEMSGKQEKTYEDRLWEDMDDEIFRMMPTVKDVTIAWNLWHLTRIEDITTNILIADRPQVFDKEWQKKCNVSVSDTGNAMSDAEIIAFSNKVDSDALRSYRIAVGRRTREILAGLKPEDLKRRFEARQLDRILKEGGVLPCDESRWLLDFWGRKNVAGILLMPVTRHQIVHMNDALRLKDKLLKIKQPRVDSKGESL